MSSSVAAKRRAYYFKNRDRIWEQRRARAATMSPEERRAKWKHERESAARLVNFKHGIGGYAHHKCRCPTCVAANEAAKARVKTRAIAEGKPLAKTPPERKRALRDAAKARAVAAGFEGYRHGSAETYRLGCRCTLCSAAKRAAKQAQAAKLRLLPAHVRAEKSRWLKRNRDARRKTDVAFRTMERLEKRVREMIATRHRHASAIRLVGCDGEELRHILESKFASGMTWENYSHKGWHIDHIRPCASFDLTDPEQQRQCFHYTNLQPLWAEINVWKSDRILAPHELEYEIAMVPFPS